MPNNRNTLKFRKFKLNTRLILALCIMSALQAILIGGFAWVNLRISLDDEIGQRALNVAKTIASTPELIAGIEQRDIPKLNLLSSTWQSANNALFIVIGDHNSIRLAHPNPKRIGKSMADDDGDTGATALIDGEAYIDTALGSLGLSVRGKAPVFDANRDIIGIVSVGYSMTQVEAIIERYTAWLLAVLIFTLIGSMAFAVIIAQRLKREIFGLEPDQIASLFEERNATLQSVREGIIAINRIGEITTFNRMAAVTLGLDEETKLIGRSIDDVLPESNLSEVLEEGHSQFDQEVWLNGRQMIVNRVPVKQGSNIIGAVSSFRPRDELDLVSQKLTRIQQYADSLRSQAHEYSNKLHTISGLIQLDAKQEALALIGNETEGHQNLISFLLKEVPDPVIAGCILGKYSRAKEMGLNLRIDPESHFSDIPKTLAMDQLVSILGNLLDNAFEATRLKTGANGQVDLSLTDIGKDVIIEVQDQGPGVPDELKDKIFTKGFSSKSGEEHGIGLHLISSIMAQCKGTIEIENNEPFGTRFILYIPKSAEEKEVKH